MTEERHRFCSPPEPGTKPPRANRLSRSSRQAESPRSRGRAELLPEFKTPTRIRRPKPASASSTESPVSDSDFQQDIVWDGASPAPRHPGRRPGKQSAGTVSISEIVSRIAPKHGRPRTSEPSLQQWIGDSASIPCTPELPATRTRKKRTSSDVLLKLAQQFDQNLFHQEEGLLSDRDLDFSDHQNLEPASDARTDPDTQLDNDLDFLFDCPTQSLSPVPVPSTEPPQPHPATLTTAAVSTATSRSSSTRDAFEDDWENDDLLNDSLVLEMTQNPHRFMTPHLCSTQNPPGQGNTAGPGPRAQKENTRPRAWFRLDRTSGFPERRNQKVWRTERSGSAVHQQRSPETGSVFTQQMCRPIGTMPEPQGFGVQQMTCPEPVWDDPADDKLLCEVCDELENQIQNRQRAVLQPTHRTQDNQIQTSAASPSGPGGGHRTDEHRCHISREGVCVAMATGRSPKHRFHDDWQEMLSGGDRAEEAAGCGAAPAEAAQNLHSDPN
uniref:ETAA1 activator of ATR kinase n=1 Tax=Oryzias latipes TaxID=8090 RepID=A0A3P9JUD4_ORYLA